MSILKPLKDCFDFPIGAGVSIEHPHKDDGYRTLLAREFNSLTTENSLKSVNAQPLQNQFDFSGGDTAVAFAQKHNMRMHGHTLAWHEMMPEWMSGLRETPDDFVTALKQHVQHVARHYKDTIFAWDALNEAVDNQGDIRPLWQNTLGAHGLHHIFAWAHEIIPQAKLFYNDFGQEQHPQKAAAIKRLISGWQDQGTPVHGVGLQMHLTIDTKPKDIEKALVEAADTGLWVHISELDIRVNTNKSKHPRFTPQRIEKQRELYRFVFQTYRDVVPKAQQHGITLWNIVDPESWVRWLFHPDWPCLYDGNGQRKYQVEA